MNRCTFIMITTHAKFSRCMIQTQEVRLVSADMSLWNYLKRQMKCNKRDPFPLFYICSKFHKLGFINGHPLLKHTFAKTVNFLKFSRIYAKDRDFISCLFAFSFVVRYSVYELCYVIFSQASTSCE